MQLVPRATAVAAAAEAGGEYVSSDGATMKPPTLQAEAGVGVLGCPPLAPLSEVRTTRPKGWLMVLSAPWLSWLQSMMGGAPA